jgi:hypothetical protein
MERIDRNNYETFFIDYLDGSLPVGEIDQLLDFLTENPDLAEELKDLEKIKLQPSDASGFSFQHLKKTDLDLPEVFEETCIRAIENDLNEIDKELFQQHISKNKDHWKKYELFRSTILEPNPLIVFENKQHLKKKGNVVLPIIWLSAAAVVLLGLFLILPDKKQHTETIASQVAEVAKPTIPNKVEVTKEILTEKKVENSKPSIKNKPQQAKENKNEPVRIVETHEPMTSLLATVRPVATNHNEITLIPIETKLSIRPPNYSKYLTPEEYFADKVDKAKEKGALGKFVLNTLKKVSGEKFEYSTSEKGKVEKLEYNSKFLAFTIPVNSPDN